MDQKEERRQLRQVATLHRTIGEIEIRLEPKARARTVNAAKAGRAVSLQRSKSRNRQAATLDDRLRSGWTC